MPESVRDIKWARVKIDVPKFKAEITLNSPNNVFLHLKHERTFAQEQTIQMKAAHFKALVEGYKEVLRIYREKYGS